ncbi:hypothetical protein GCM10011386_10250 [Parapedobacter defluvii]|uniref:Uncharacterized protein n=1 Tax=Parapedobacter defluvii TaxID=2045106 RepID=A0ABQ1L9A6_9SPHI|nr:DUF6266 family protein [Parapedobacter defluvii]GGC20293.1 hypothetical protein GCM10011386_10250 [Parapedobacter defluvii]
MDFFYDKSKPKVKEKSYGKLAVQQRLRLAMAFLNPLRSIIAQTWLGYGKGNKSKAFGQALKKLIQDAIEGQYPDQWIAPDRVAISIGMLPSVDIQDVVLGPEALEIYFSSEENPLAKAADEVVLVAYSPDAGIAGRNPLTCTRKEGYIKVDLPPQLQATPFHAYLFVHSASKKQYSKSVYVGYMNNDGINVDMPEEDRA